MQILRSLLALVLLIGLTLGIRYVVTKPIREVSEPTAVNAPVTPPSTPTSGSETAFFYPMTRYAERLTNRWHGKEIGRMDRLGLPCGDFFDGFHVGDDLEVFPEELSQEVPVFAITDGIVRQHEAVNGYGGLLAIEYTLNGQQVTAYYGHIDVGQSKLEEGDTVTAGKQIAVLGDHCSPETSNERKHLHFSIHNDPEIDVRGYVESTQELEAWTNPRELLRGLGAEEPGRGSR